MVAALVAGPVRAEEAAAARSRSLAFPGIGPAAGFDDKSVSLVEELVLAALDATKSFRVVGISDVAALLGHEKRRQALGCEENAGCIAEIAGALGVDLLASAALGRLGDRTIVTLKIVDAKTAAALARGKRTVQSDGEIPAAVDALVREVADALALGPVASPPAPAPAATACEDGRLDRGGHCCWPGQDWGAESARCVGKPACPDGRVLTGDECVPGCPVEGQLVVGGHCCWRGQDWGTAGGQCVGHPDCPDGWRLNEKADGCTRLEGKREKLAPRHYVFELGAGFTHYKLDRVAPAGLADASVLYPEKGELDQLTTHADFRLGVERAPWMFGGGARLLGAAKWSYPALFGWATRELARTRGGLLVVEGMASAGFALALGSRVEVLWVDRNTNGERDYAGGDQGTEVYYLAPSPVVFQTEVAALFDLRFSRRFSLATTLGWMQAFFGPTRVYSAATGATATFELEQHGVKPDLDLSGPLLRLALRFTP